MEPVRVRVTDGEAKQLSETVVGLMQCGRMRIMGATEQAVAGLLLHIGMPAHLSGYRFLLRSVLIVMEQPEALWSITHGLYPAVADYYATTASRVERSIRHAINMTWQRSGAPAFARVLEGRMLSEGDKPTNCELIALLYERVRLGEYQSNTGS